MHLCVNRLTALALLRWLRSTGEPLDHEPCGVPSPDPWPQLRWSTRIIPYQQLGRSGRPDAQRPIEVAVPDAGSRSRARFFRMTVYGDGLPAGSFARVSSEFTIPCPELLFLELASVMDPAALELVGYEICGTFSRDPANPRTGGVTHGLSPLTSVQKIKDYLSRCTGIRGLGAARRAIERVRDDAWSAMEAIVALLLVRPQNEGGYGIGELVLNERENAPDELKRRGVRGSRVPDIGLANLPVGFNYDGRGHLDLGSIPVETQSAAEIKAALAEVRGKYVDDLRRNRELLAGGRIVMPIVAEDLMEYGEKLYTGEDHQTFCRRASVCLLCPDHRDSVCELRRYHSRSCGDAEVRRIHCPSRSALLQKRKCKIKSFLFRNFLFF